MRVLLAAVLIAPLLAGCIASEPPVSDDLVVSEDPSVRLEITWAPALPSAGEEVTFTSKVFSPHPDDAIDDLAWEIGDRTYRDHTLTFRFPEAGDHAVRLLVSTTLGGTVAEDVTVQVLAPAGRPGGNVTGSIPDVGGVVPPTILVNQTGNAVSLSFDWPLQPDQVHWDLGDGTNSSQPAPRHEYLDTGNFSIILRIAFGALVQEASTTVEIKEVPFIPHVLVAVPDTGVNPYHEAFYRPQLTAHPCTYIRDFPCDIPALDLSLGQNLSWDQAFKQDKKKWESIEPGQWFWIPRTVFIAVHCDEPYTGSIYDVQGLEGEICILDDSHMHGTGTVGSVISENPDALIAFSEGHGSVQPFVERGLPVDIFSVSWGSVVPVPLWTRDAPSIYVTGAGNDPRSTVVDGWKGDPRVISVGGAYAQDDTEEEMAAKQPEVVSYFCRPTPQTRSIDETRESYCGTSFSAPTVAGALSKVVLAVRQASGYEGGIVGDMVDPLHGLSRGDLRTAMNLTASYAPEAQYDNAGLLPLNPAAPWIQWGWGFYDGTVAEGTIDHIFGTELQDKPQDAKDYMELMFELKKAGHL